MFSEPVLIEGGEYQGIWLEGGILRADGFYQQLPPFEGYMRVSRDYSPATFVLIDFARRFGLRRTGEEIVAFPHLSDYQDTR